MTDRTASTRTPALAAAFLLTWTLPALLPAQGTPGLDTWVDACEATDADLAILLESEAAMIAPGLLIARLDGDYALLSEPFEHIPELGESARLCSDSRFYGQPRPDAFPAGRSAFLVGPDLVLTANHFISPDVVPGHDFVFGLRHHVSPWGSCEPPDVTRIPTENVYRAVEIVAHGGDPLDFVLLRLDREVAGRPWVRVRRSGRGRVGDRVTMVGHPEMLPTKVDLAASYAGTTLDRVPRIAGAHVLIGNSGSVVYNRDRQLAESAVRSGSCAGFRYRDADGCFELYSDCSAGPVALGHALIDFAPNVPAFELVVDSLDDVVHVVAAGQPLPDPDHTYAVTAPETAAGPIHYRITPPAPGPADEPRLEIEVRGPLEGTLSPGKSIAIDSRASLDTDICGRFERSFTVEDLTHGFVDRPRHVFEIGLTEIGVAPATGWTVADLAPPYEDFTDYVVSNARFEPATVTVSTNRDWIVLEALTPTPGDGDSTITWTLAAAGEPGDRAELRVRIGGSAPGLPPGVWQEGVVSFTNVSGDCGSLGSTSRTVRFLPGLEELSSAGVAVPIPDASPDGVESRIEVPEPFCIGDVDLLVRSTGQNANHLTVDLTAPSGRTVRVWDRNGPDAIDLRRWFDDETTPPPTGELLSTLDGDAGAGTWTLRLVDGVAGGVNELESWTLRLLSSGAPPCGAVGDRAGRDD